VTQGDTPSTGSTPNTQIRRLPERQVHDRAALDALLDAALVAQVAVVDEGRPYVVPLAFARDGDRLLVHGSTASRAFRVLAQGVRTCVSVTVLDAVVVARSQFHSSMNYRSAMVLGAFAQVVGEDKDHALHLLTARLLPGVDWQRPPSRKEAAQTSVLALALAQWSVKASAEDSPQDDPSDIDAPVWAGVVPLTHTWGSPRPAPDLPAGVDRATPRAILDWPQGRA